MYFKSLGCFKRSTIQMNKYASSLGNCSILCQTENYFGYRNTVGFLQFVFFFLCKLHIIDLFIKILKKLLISNILIGNSIYPEVNI